MRWFDYLQHVADKTGVFKPVAFQIPEPDLKPPTAPPPKVCNTLLHPLFCLLHHLSITLLQVYLFNVKPRRHIQATKIPVVACFRI